MIKVGYRNADTVGLLWIDRYLDLTSEQQAFVKPRLRALVAWHRTTQLPDYATLGTEMKKLGQRAITPAEVTALAKQLRQRIDISAQHALPDMADLALKLTPDNIGAMEDKFADNDDKFRDDNHVRGEVEKQQKARYDKTLDRVEEWYGRFSREQRAAIRKLSDARPLDNDILLAERQRRERELVALLTRIEREKPSRDAVIGLLRGYNERFEFSPDRDKRAFQESMRRATEAMDAAIHNLATPAQRERAIAKLQDWIDDFRSLSGAAS
ncbi:MAG: DUF6279 family lipoprotein [Burkholderiaceae bacterium]